MIVRFFKTGQSRGEAPVNYLFSAQNHEGIDRHHAPELLEGSPRLTIDIINGISRQHKYASGCLAFRPEEQPTQAELAQIIDRFKAVVAPGLSPDQYNSLFVLHREKPDPKTGLAGFHVHFVFPMTLLAGKTAAGKDLTGKRWNPHPPGQRTIETMALFTSIINHEHGWPQVMENPMRVGMDSFWRKANQTGHIGKVDLLHKELAQAIRKGNIRSRDALCQYLDDTLGLTITRQTETSVSVKFPGSPKAIRLKGAMFETASDYMTLQQAESQTHGTESFSVPQYLQAKTRLDALLCERARDLAGRRPNKNANTTRRKERNHGTNRSTEYGREGDTAACEADVRKPAFPVPKSGLGRNLFPASHQQWSHEHGSHGQAGHARPQEASNPSQHAQHEGFSPTQGRRQPIPRRGVTQLGTDINEKIWALAIELNGCELGSLEANAIQAQLNELMGERNRLANSPKPRLR